MFFPRRKIEPRYICEVYFNYEQSIIGNCIFVCRTPLFSRTMIPERNCLLQNHSARSLLSAFTPGDLISHCSHSNESLAIASRPQWHIWLTVCSSKAVLWTFGRLKARSQQSLQLRCTDGRKDIARYWYILVCNHENCNLYIRSTELLHSDS